MHEDPYTRALVALGNFLREIAVDQDARVQFFKHVDESWLEDTLAAFQVQCVARLEEDEHRAVALGLRYLVMAFFKLGYDARGPALVWHVNDKEGP